MPISFSPIQLSLFDWNSPSVLTQDNMLAYNMDHCCTYDDFPTPQMAAATTTAMATLQPHPLYPPPPLVIPEHDALSALRPELGCSSYGGSPNSISNDRIRRSISSHSINKNMEVYSSPPRPNFERSVRKALSSGDLEAVNFVQHTRLASSSPLANENTILESMNRASPYSSEEKKERIERYRSKRNLRNFNKKIKYECRKTLADNRPRIRGRFARNDEAEKATQSQWDHRAGNEDDEEEDNWRNFIDSFQAHLMP